ncbi:MAG: hypothetical protein R3B96_17745 [Pirellulaceae bacterium]
MVGRSRLWAIDGNEGLAGPSRQLFNQNHAAVIQFADRVSLAKGDMLQVSLVHKFSDGKHLLGHLA